jgi:hypothetical protein
VEVVRMMKGKSLKVTVASTAAGAALLIGGVLIGGTLVSAQTPEPTAPAPQTTPRDGAQQPQDGEKECDREDEGTSTGVRTRGGGAGVRF